ncbi:heat shock protein HspQ [Rhizobium sp. CRIBSB]|nr:heat shock protein HspQ [Rhizobium sp. CRIBSB]
MTNSRTARFGLGQIVRHRDDAFSGVVLDVDATFAGPGGMTGETTPDQPFYRVFVAGPDGGFVVYAAEEFLFHDPRTTLAPGEARRLFDMDGRGHHAPGHHRLQ